MIDMHMHAYPDWLAPKAVGNLKEAFHGQLAGDGTVSDIRRILDVNHFQAGVIVPIASKPERQRGINDFAISINKDQIMAFGSLHPYAINVQEELKRVKENGLWGIKFHPHFQGYNIDCVEALRAYEACAKMEMPYLIHCGFDTAHKGQANASYEKVTRIIPHVEGSNVILAHMAVNGRFDELNEKILGKQVYLDTAMVHRFTSEQIRTIILQHGQNKILFGSDYPWGEIGRTLSCLKEAGLTQEQMNEITVNNAKKILNL